MCGSYTLDVNKHQKLLSIIQLAYQRNGLYYNKKEFFPKMMAPVLIMKEGQLVVELMQWGFDYNKQTVINARTETALDKGMFKEHYINQRCVVLTTGFYEFNRHKNRYLMTVENQDMVYLAGIYRYESDRAHYVVLTKAANSIVAPIHSRMPVILDKDEVNDWLGDKGVEREISKVEKKMIIELDSSYETLSMFEE